MGRHILAWVLTVALIVSGIPFAHAIPSQVPVAPVVQDTAAHSHDAGHAIHHQVQHDTASDVGNDTTEPGKTANDLCKGLKCCSMCATAYVAPSLRHLNIDLVSFAVQYAEVIMAHPQAMIFVDPGIPIV